MEVNNDSAIMKVFGSTLPKSNESSLSANQLSDLVEYLKSYPEYIDIISSLESQVNSSQKYTLNKTSGWSQVNLQSSTLSSLVGASSLYSNSGDKFYSLMDNLFYQQESKDGSSSDQIDLSMLSSNELGVTTSLAATINKAK